MHAPPTLAAFLDYGGDVSAFPCLDGLVEAVVVRRRLNTDEQNAADHAFYATCVEQWLLHGPDAVPELGGGGFTATQATLTAFAWAAECFADQGAAQQFEEALPADVYLESIDWVTQRKARAAG